MMQYSIVPVLMETGGADIIYPSDKSAQFELNKHIKFAMLISDTPSKTFSLCVKINSQLIRKAQDPTVNRIIIKVDNSIVGPLVLGDQVLLLKYSPPLATQVLIGINNKYYLPEGDWGREIINPALDQLMIDAGNKIEFMYGYQKPILVEAIVKATIPKPPVIINDLTIFNIEKIDHEQVVSIRMNSEDMKEIRAKAYILQIENQTFRIISAIRTQKTDEYSKTFNFSNVNPKEIYNALKQSLIGYRLETNDTSDYSEGFSSFIVAIPKNIHPVSHLLEFQISGKINQGKIGFWTYTLKIGEAILISQKWEKIITNLTQSMKEIPQAIPNLCQACGAELQILKQNQKGIVQCIKCNMYNQLPMSLRSF